MGKLGVKGVCVITLCAVVFSAFPVLSRAEEAAAVLEKKAPQPAAGSTQAVSATEKKYPAFGGSKQPSPAELAAAMKGMSSGMAAMMGEMYSAIFDFIAKKETAAKLAAFTRNYYDELMKAGFTKEEAMQLVTSVGMPAMSGK